MINYERKKSMFSEILIQALDSIKSNKMRTDENKSSLRIFLDFRKADIEWQQKM